MGRRITNGVALPGFGTLSVQTNTIETVQAAENLILDPTGVLQVTKTTEVRNGNSIRLYDDDNTQYLGFTAPSNVTTNTTWILPDGDGDDGQVLKTDGSGNLSFGDPGIALDIVTSNTTYYPVFTSNNSDSQIGTVYGATNFRFNASTGQLYLTNTTASSSKTTGVLRVAGGIGVSGNSVCGNFRVDSLGVGTDWSGTGGEIRATNAITAYYSDQRLKEISGNIPNALDKVVALNGVMYTQNKLAEDFGYNDYSPQVGLIAQQVQEVLPEVVKPAPFDIESDGTSKSGENYLTIQYEKVIPLLVEAIKELKQEVDRLKGE